MTRSTLCVTAVLVGTASAFTVVPQQQHSRLAASTTTSLHMGLFDGVKEAFSAPALERSKLDAERETPIDRWMGWSVRNDNEQQAQQSMPSDFIDSMDAASYIAVELEKPMGIVFEENDEEFGGIFVQSLKEGGIAAKSGVLESGDQLVAVNTVKVAGMVFDEALGTIVAATTSPTKLVFFRGSAKQLYGPTGASQEWLDEFVAGGAVPASTTAASS